MGPCRTGTIDRFVDCQWGRRESHSATQLVGGNSCNPVGKTFADPHATAR